MKIIITKEDLLFVLSNHFNIKVTEFTLENPLVEQLQNFIKQHPAYQTTGKIGAIKGNRELNLGKEMMHLADAKYVIENWDKLIQFVQREGRMPNEGCNWKGMN